MRKIPPTSHERQVHRSDRTVVRLPAGRIHRRGQRAEFPRYSAHGVDQTVRNPAQDHLPAEDLPADQPRKANVQRGDGKGRLQGLLQLLLLHKVEPLLVRPGGGHEERYPPRNLLGVRYPHNQRPLRQRNHRQRPIHRLQRVQTPAVRREHRPARERRIHQHDPRARQQGGARPLRGRIHQKMQGRHTHRLRGGAEVRLLYLAPRHPVQRHRGLLQGKTPQQQEVPAQDAPLLHQHRNQGHRILLERAVEVHERILRAQGHLPRVGQPQHRRRFPHQELPELRVRLRVPHRGDRRPDQEHLPAERSRRAQHLHRIRTSAKAAPRSTRSSTRSSRTTARTGT